jgi:hypothetical protein
MLYALGRGVTQNRAEAAYWYRKATGGVMQDYIQALDDFGSSPRRFR